MRIGETARKAGVGVETVRFYERRGLVPLPPRPSNGGYRDYSVDTIKRIRFIRCAKRLGFSLAEIAELLDLEIAERAQCVDIRRRAEAKRDIVQSRLDDLTLIRDALDALIEDCPGKGPMRQCSILEAIKSGHLDLSLAHEEKGDV